MIKKGNSNGRSIKQGDIVTIMEEGMSNRGTWKLVRVQEVHPANDGLAQGATVEVISNKGKRIRIKRPLQKLYPLEVTTREVADASSPTHYRSEQRPRRKAAVAGEMKRRQVDQYFAEINKFDEQTEGGRCLNFLSLTHLRRTLRERDHATHARYFKIMMSCYFCRVQFRTYIFW